MGLSVCLCTLDLHIWQQSDLPLLSHFHAHPDFLLPVARPRFFQVERLSTDPLLKLRNLWLLVAVLTVLWSFACRTLASSSPKAFTSASQGSVSDSPGCREWRGCRLLPLGGHLAVSCALGCHLLGKLSLKGIQCLAESSGCLPEPGLPVLCFSASCAPVAGGCGSSYLYTRPRIAMQVQSSHCLQGAD